MEVDEVRISPVEWRLFAILNIGSLMEIYLLLISWHTNRHTNVGITSVCFSFFPFLTEKLLKELGYKKSGDIRKPQHILWFIRYQVQKCTVKQVADYYTSEHKVLSEDTVSKALHKISALLQIPLRSRM